MLGNINSESILIYLIILNIIGFLCMWFDKRAAQNNQYRIPESFLFSIALIGGSIGVWGGMYVFHHKTKKLHFVYGLPVILILQIWVLVY